MRPTRSMISAVVSGIWFLELRVAPFGVKPQVLRTVG